MTNTTSILGNPSRIPNAAPTPSQEERLLASAAYLGYFTGFWLVVPIVIYVLKRDKSRFVAHHALRAVLLHVLAVPVLVVSWVFPTVVTIAMVYALESSGRGLDGDESGVAAFLWLVGWAVPWVIYVAICVLAAVRGFQGRVDTRSVLGRMVERFLGQDKSVAA